MSIIIGSCRLVCGAEAKGCPGPSPGRGQALIQRVALRLEGVEGAPRDRSRLSRRHELKPRGAGEGATLKNADPPEGHRLAPRVQEDLCVGALVPGAVFRVGTRGGVLRVVHGLTWFCGRPVGSMLAGWKPAGLSYVEAGRLSSPLDALLYTSTFNGLFRVQSVKNPARHPLLSNVAWNTCLRFRFLE